MLRFALLIGAVLAFVPVSGQAAEEKGKAVAPKNTTPAKKPSASEGKTVAREDSFKVKVISVKGVVQKLLSSNPKAGWKPVKVGEYLDEGTLIRTGLGAEAVLRFADRGQFRVKSGTKAGIAKFRKQGNLVKARLGLKYGSMRARVDSSRGPNDFQVKTPVATLSVKGSEANFGYSGDQGLTIHTTQHTWNVSTSRGSKRLTRGESTNGNLTPWNVLASQGFDTQTGDPFGGLTGLEKGNLRQNGGGRGIFNFTGGGGNTPPIIDPYIPPPTSSGRVPIPIPPSPPQSLE